MGQHYPQHRQHQQHRNKLPLVNLLTCEHTHPQNRRRLKWHCQKFLN
jgi:hypothetical protein